MEKNTRGLKPFCLLLIIALIFSAAETAYAMKLFRIGTGGKTGVYYPVGKLIAQGLTETPQGKEKTAPDRQGLPGYIGVAQSSAGSVENMNTIVSGETEAGLV